MRFRHKFKAKPVNDDGSHFSSTLEWKYFKHLQFLKNIGEVVFFLRQVPIHLPGGIKYVADFLVFYKNESAKFIDVKGVETETFRIKKKLVEELYPFEIEIVKKGDF